MQLKPKQITGISSDRDPLTFFTCQTMELLLHFDFYMVWRHELISFGIALLTTGRLTIGRRTISLGSVWQWASNHCCFWNLLPHSWSGSWSSLSSFMTLGSNFFVPLMSICSWHVPSKQTGAFFSKLWIGIGPMVFQPSFLRVLHAICWEPGLYTIQGKAANNLSKQSISVASIVTTLIGFPMALSWNLCVAL